MWSCREGLERETGPDELHLTLQSVRKLRRALACARWRSFRGRHRPGTLDHDCVFRLATGRSNGEATEVTRPAECLRAVRFPLDGRLWPGPGTPCATIDCGWYPVALTE